jgi:hypothetical protein
MEGGIAIFLLFLIIVFGLVLALLFGGLGGGIQALNEKRAGKRESRPTHAVVADDGSSTAKRGDRLPD